MRLFVRCFNRHIQKNRLKQSDKNMVNSRRLNSKKTSDVVKLVT